MKIVERVIEVEIDEVEISGLTVDSPELLRESLVHHLEHSLGAKRSSLAYSRDIDAIDAGSLPVSRREVSGRELGAQLGGVVTRGMG